MTSVTFPPSLGGDGSTVSDDSNPATGLGNGGHRTRFIPAMGQTLACMNSGISQATAQVAAAAAEVVLAEGSADAAAASAVEAAGYAATALSAPGTNATSTTSLTIGTGSKSLTLAQTGKSFAVGQFVELVNATANWMLGNITAFNSGTGAMTVDVTHIGGSGTFAAWTVTPAVPSQLPSPSGNAGKAILANSAGNGYVFAAVDVMPYSARSSNTILAVADKGYLVDITSGTFSQTVDAAATLSNGWQCVYRNSGTGVVTIDPNGAETIGGASTLALRMGDTYIIGSNGTNLYAIQIDGDRGCIKVSDQKASGTAGGASVATDITQTRTLNTVDVNTIVGASLATNQVTLPAGTYRARASAPSKAGRNRLLIYNVTDATYVALGSNGSSNNQTHSDAFGQFTITASKVFSLRHWTQSAFADGLGEATTIGQVEVYAQLEFEKVA